VQILSIGIRDAAVPKDGISNIHANELLIVETITCRAERLQVKRCCKIYRQCRWH
jgi:hypothetical protein